MIAIIDYGLGNVQAFANIYKRLGVPALLATDATELADASHIILPGVGAFDWAMTRLNQSGMRSMLERRVLDDGIPVLGICVGMQMMAKDSDEGRENGLGWFDASVKLFDDTQFSGATHLPHMGWNDVLPRHEDGLFSGLEKDARFYFLHSYYFAPNDDSDVLSTTGYSTQFSSSVRRGNVHGVQFHPEKSHGWGIRLLQNFAGL